MPETAHGYHAPAQANKGLTQQTFETLLAHLDNDRNLAAQRYETIRKKLIRLFAWRGWQLPEELADETLDRVAARLQAGVELRVADPYRYISGVASRVFLEKVRERGRLQRQRDEYQRHVDSQLHSNGDDQEEQQAILLECLQHCLAQVSIEERDLILRYYENERSLRINNRKSLARELGLSPGTLRIRAFRIRQRLEQCTVRCASDE